MLMQDNPDNSLLLRKLVNLIRESLPGCLAIYRFGSWGTADQQAASDIDLAVLPSVPLDPLRRWDLAQQLASLAGRDVDLVDLLNASTVLRMQVISSGDRLYCSAHGPVELFEDNVFSGYARFNLERRSIIEDVKKRGKIYAD